MAMQAIVAFVFAAVIAVLHPWDAQIMNSRWLRPVTLCGTMCYSLYLVHAPIVAVVSRVLDRMGARGDAAVVLVVLPVSTLISVLAGWIFYRLVERKFLNTSPRTTASAGTRT